MREILKKTFNTVLYSFVLAGLPLLVILSSGFAEEKEIVNVKTFVSQDGVKPGGSIKAAFLLKILPGWHINAPELADEFLISSQLIIEEDDHIKILKLYYPEGIMSTFGYSDSEVEIYEGEVILGALIKVRDDTPERTHVLKVKLLYQPCDDQSCLAPQTLDVKVPFRVVPLSKQIKETNKEIFSKIHFEQKDPS